MYPSQRNKLQQPHRIKLPAYDEIGLVLQGGGALGSYQAGVYEGMAEIGVEPTRISGVSIGALNTAIIAGNAPADRAEALRGFWNTISQPADFLSHIGARIPAWAGARRFGAQVVERMGRNAHADGRSERVLLPAHACAFPRARKETS
ncbi:putative acylesterase/phospholipase RssA [Paraburkholderia bryophila]|uniref:Putative acylesterase/phospholipase RssA n=1 Tax=Paraburkholderia bryophila TaxID=420952 RepID=A0A7Y9W5B9_9BURK|nr:putative acylesterase/phospholipase RssA [Paraburkholderia bryophila]